jgi:hypothetical protein
MFAIIVIGPSAQTTKANESENVAADRCQAPPKWQIGKIAPDTVSNVWLVFRRLRYKHSSIDAAQPRQRFIKQISSAIPVDDGGWHTPGMLSVG